MFLSNLLENQYKYVNRRVMLRHTYPIVALAITAVVYWAFYAPILYDDDWSFVIGRWYSNSLHWFDWAERRPLVKAPLLILYTIFGLNLDAFYIVLWVLNVCAAVQLYFLIRRFIPKSIPIAFSIAAIFLFYPADFTHMWLTMIVVRVVVVLTLMYAHLLLIYADTGRRSVLWTALLCLVFSFGVYDGQFGVTMAWGLVLIVMKKATLWRQRPGLLLPFGVGLAFVLWRTVGYSAVGAGDGYLNGFQLTPIVIISRLISGYRIMLWAWVEPIMYVLGLDRWLAIVIILLTMTFCGFTAYVISRANRKLQNINLTGKQHLNQLRRFIFMVLIGSIFIAAGYIPVVTIFSPTLFSVHSRINLFALPGAGVTIVALLAMGILLLEWSLPRINVITLAAVLPLIVLGMAIQVQVQYDSRVAWEQQKHIWQEFFELVPDLEDGTMVYFKLFDDEQLFSLNKHSPRSPLRVSWEVGTALNVLYRKRNLGGDVVTKELLFEQGIKNRYTGNITPYDGALFVTYDGKPRRLRILEDLQSENLVDFPIPDYAPYERIIKTPTAQTDLRWLVGVTTDAGNR